MLVGLPTGTPGDAGVGWLVVSGGRWPSRRVNRRPRRLILPGAFAFVTEQPEPPNAAPGNTGRVTESNLRSVSLARTGPHTFEAVNSRGTRLILGEGDTGDFTPIELLLAATAACSAMDVDHITGRRAEPESFQVGASAPKLHDELGNHLGEIQLDFRVRFPAGQDGDNARSVLARALAQSRDRLCTVSRTVQLPTQVGYLIDGEPVP